MDWERYLKIGIYTGIFATPFIGLIVANIFFFPFITGKNFSFRIITEVIFGLWAILALMNRAYRPQKSLALILGGLFVVSIGISTALAENPTKAFWSNFERMEGYITVLHLAMYVLVLTSMMRTEELWRKFLLTSIGASVIVGIYSLFQLSGAFAINQGGLRIDATFGNATYFAVYMLIHAFLSLIALTHWSGNVRWKQLLFGGTFLLQVILVFYSATRGSILGVVGGLLLSGLIIAFSKGTSVLVRRTGIALLIAVILSTGGFFAIKDTAYVQNHDILSRIASISLDAGATRFQIWGMALKGFEERPLFGWGQEGFNYVFNKYYYAGLYAQEPWFDRAHNVALDWLIAGGAFGAALYLSLYAVLLWYLWRPGNAFDAAERALFTGLLAGYAFHNVFVFDNLMSYLMFMIIFSYITVRANPSKEWGPTIDSGTMSIAAPSIIVATLVVIYFANGSGIASASGLIEGIKPQTGGITQNVQYFADAASRSGLGAQEVAEQYLQFAIQLRQVGAGDEALQLSVANAARERFLRELDENPGDARLQVFFGSFLRQFGDLQGAKDHLAKALALSPEKQNIMFELGSTYLLAGNTSEALQIFKKAYDLEPTYEQALLFYASAAIETKEQQLADSLLIPKYGTNTPDNVYILQAYIKAKDFAKALSIATSRVEKDQKSVQKRLELASVYLQSGDKESAIAAIEEAIQIDPSFKAQGDSYISQIRSGKI